MTRRALVTGAAGFIGSHLCERLVADGWQVTGVDCFTNYYARTIKEANLVNLKGQTRFNLVEADLSTVDLAPLLAGIDVVFHQAGQAGVRASWGTDFRIYAQNNVLATQRLLEAARHSGLHRFVNASSSSVYGDTSVLPVDEDTLPQPVSPYGVTKLAAEHLCRLYYVNYSVPCLSLRYFTVYGPRQRPDMAFYKFICALLLHQQIYLYGDGEQTRDFTFISDAVEANLLAVEGPSGNVFNIGGGSRVTLNHVISTLEDLVGEPAQVQYQDRQAGDVRHTWADTSAARKTLGFLPRVSLSDGLAAEVAWLQEQPRL